MIEQNTERELGQFYHRLKELKTKLDNVKC